MQHDNAVSAEDAYEAAVARAARTQHALILAEAQILTWKRLYVHWLRRAEAAEAEVERLKGGQDGEEGDGSDPAAVGAVDSEGPVPV